MADRWTLTEADKDRIAGMWKRHAGGDPHFWPEDKLNAAVAAEYGQEGCAFLSGLLLAIIAHHDERGPDPIIASIDAASDGTVKRGDS